jgi:hypothetical protein
MKDAKGHGSDTRGGARAVVATAYDGRPTWHGMAGGKKVTNSAGNPIAYASPEAAIAAANDVGGPSIRPGDRTYFGGGQPVASNAHAAATLASGPKSAPVDTHPAFNPDPKVLEENYRAQHGWSGDVGKHNGG